MKLANISANGMQIHCNNLDLLKGQPRTQVFEFEVRIVANLKWINANPDETLAIGWEFDNRLHPKTDASDSPEISEEEKSLIQNVEIPYPILAELDTGEYLKLKLMDISTTSMRTICTDLDVLKLGPANKPFYFNLPITARLGWMDANPNNTFTVGWEFEQSSP